MNYSGLRTGELGTGIRRDRSHEACSLIEIQFFFLHKCICSQRMIASICLRSRVLNVLIFMIFASVLIPLWRSVSFFFFGHAAHVGS